ncbi:MAG: preprotein translocase subunit SecA [Myxococcota bacterium]|jgi:preprotein translocase subunit SecA
MAFGWFKKLIPSKNDREVKKLGPTLEHITSFEPGLQKLTDVQLGAKTVEFKERIAKGESLDDLMSEAFAVVRESAWRTMKLRPYDVQMVGGIVLHRGGIAEMKTGEGKTLMATLPIYLHALTGRGAHLVTVNDYLATRDAEWMATVYNFLGLSVGSIVSDMSDVARKRAYGSDITYGTNNEFGFDYLRDNMKFRYEQYVHRYFAPPADAKDEKARTKILNFAIVDEVDSVLIDEARTPLIISGPSDTSSDQYHRVNAIIPFLRRDEDFLVDEKAHSVTLTETGVDKVEHRLKVDNLYDSENILLNHHVSQALKAHFLYKREQHYLVENNEVVIVDEFTGRKMAGRRWSDGLHQAVEAKEGVKVKEENQTLATITFQNFFRMYQTLSGMTGTAETEAAEFASIYDLDVTVVPTNKPIARLDHEDLVYKTERAKLTAVVNDILDANIKGQPILVGTASVENSEKIHKVLTKREIKHNVLNAKHHEMEAEVVAQAGRLGAVTIATNMAGRGTDIMLGGNPELMAKHELGFEDGEVFDARLIEFREQCAAEKQEVIGAGGLHIIGTERHESRRIDNQLRGRSGRQGDPGSSRFYLSLDDDLMRIFGGDRIKKIMEMLKVPDDEPIEHKMVSKAVENAQSRVEGQNFDIRKNVLEYDDVMNLQRRTIYGLRRKVLEGSETHEMFLESIGDHAHVVCDRHCVDIPHTDGWDFDALQTDIRRSFNHSDYEVERVHDFDIIFNKLEVDMRTHYLEREERLLETLRLDIQHHNTHLAEENEDHAVPPEEVIAKAADEQWRFFEREQYLRAIDGLWKAHLVQMDHLRTGVHLNAYAQKDPKLIYKQEGYTIFQDLLVRISEEAVRRLYHVQVKSSAEIEALRNRREDKPVVEGRGAGSGEAPKAKQEKQETVRRERPKTGRNDPCYCGSGKKYKKCHLPADAAAAPD